VHRARLAARLDLGMHGVLTLLSAPAGWGKTTLLADWLRSKTSGVSPGPAVAWLSLDEGDNDPVSLIRDLAAALRAAVPGVGDPPGVLLDGPESPRPRTLITRLVNDLVMLPQEIILVLDDYHVVRQASVHEIVAFLLERLPPTLHVVLSTREDPPLPFARLRALGALCEVRAADLSFTADETATFLRETMARPVSAEEAAALAGHTEGWIAGLQLAALAMPADNVAGFVATFGGSHYTVLDYLGAEVLARQPLPVRTFLLRTSVLDRLSGPLCDAVLGDEQPEGGAQAMLERIERGNLFLAPLDGERHWYRYHQLFAEFLRVHLSHAKAELVPELHRRASGWYEAHGLVQDAIRHALAALDHDRATRLIEQHGMTEFYFGEREKILGWFHALPADVRESHPQLSIIYACALVTTGQMSAADVSLRDAERHLGSDLQRDAANLIRGRVALLRALMASVAGDRVRAVALAEEARVHLRSSDAASGAFAAVLASRAFRVTGDATAATEHAVAAAAEEAKTAGLRAPAHMGAVLVARVHVLQGRLHRARVDFTEAERTLGVHATWGFPTYCFGLGDLLREWNDLEGAEAVVTRGIGFDLEGLGVDAGVAAEGHLVLARIRQARGDHRGAMAVLDEFHHLSRRRDMPEEIVARATAARAHLWLKQGNLTAAVRWAETSGLSERDQASYPQELEHLVFARVLIAQKRPGVLSLLDRLLEGAEGHGRMGSAIEILALRAIAQHALGATRRALQDLGRALAHGEPEGYVRVFVDEGAPMATLLRRARAGGIAPEYAARLLEAFVTRAMEIAPTDLAAPHPVSTGPVRPGHVSPLVEPLTVREREIVRLIAAGTSNQQIAAQLFVTTGTVKTHIRSIFGKLGVKSRTQVIVKAKTLGLD